jgi:hypothetical protein
MNGHRLRQEPCTAPHSCFVDVGLALPPIVSQACVLHVLSECLLKEATAAHVDMDGFPVSNNPLPGLVQSLVLRHWGDGHWTRSDTWVCVCVTLVVTGLP